MESGILQVLRGGVREEKWSAKVSSNIEPVDLKDALVETNHGR